MATFPALAASVTLAWDAVTSGSVAGYTVHWGTSSGSYGSQVNAGTGTTYTVSGLNEGTTYYFAVTAFDGQGGRSGYSNQVSKTIPATTDATAPSAPSSLAATATGPTAVSLAWGAATDNVGVTGYRVESCAGASCTAFAQIATTTGTSYSHTGLVASTNYRYRVRAVDAAGNLGAYSVIASATTPSVVDATAPSAPGTPVASVTSGSSISVSWGAATDNVGVTGYLVERCTGATCTSFAQVATTTGTSYANTGLATNTTYRYRVRARDAAGNLGAYSGIASATTSTTSVLQDAGLKVDEQSASGTVSNANGILEPGETVLVVPRWKLASGATVSLTATASVSGQQSSAFQAHDTGASYGTISVGQTTDCQLAGGNCYRVSVSKDYGRPGSKWELILTETLSTGQKEVRSIHIGRSFSDVSTTSTDYDEIESLVRNNVTVGYSDGTFRPSAIPSRLTTMMFVARALTDGGGESAVPASGTIGGVAYSCTSGGKSLYADLAPTESGCKHAHFLASRNLAIRNGCSVTNSTCKADSATRRSLAVLLAGAMAGSDAAVPMSGTFSDTGTTRSYNCGVTGGSAFPDVSTSASYCRHVHYLWARGVMGTYSDGTFRPNDVVQRGRMARFISAAFDLTTE